MDDLQNELARIDERVSDLSESERRSGVARLLAELEATGVYLTGSEMLVVERFRNGGASLDELSSALADRLAAPPPSEH